jgi:hypothetical protein
VNRNSRGLLRRLEDALRSDSTAVFIVTVSVQGLVVGGQLLAALVVQPEHLGQIRWLESAFAIALMTTSCGMPSIAFRDAALAPSEHARRRLLLEAVALSSVGCFALLAACAIVVIVLSDTPAGPTSMLLLAMAGSLIPANAGRIGTAILLGAELSRRHAKRLLLFSVVAMSALAFAARWGGPNGWVAMRFAVELTLVGVLFPTLLSGTGWREAIRWPGWWALGALLKKGASANYGFLIRVLADNLAVLLLRTASWHPAELGWYGLANLILFAPILVLSVTMQSRLPALIKSARDRQAFEEGLSTALYALLRVAVLWCVAMLAIAYAVHQQQILPGYAKAAVPLALLAASLPARALVLTAGGAAIVHGWFIPGSVLAIVEILVVATAWLLGAVEAAQFAFAVAVAQVLACVPAWFLLRAARRACRP